MAMNIGLKEKLLTLSKNVWFNRLYVTFVMVLTVTFWGLGTAHIVPGWTVLALIVITCAIALFTFNDFKYFISSVIAFMFANPDGYSSSEAPVAMLICGFSYVGVLLTFTFINRKKISYKNKNKSFLAFIYFAIFSFLPLTYHNLLEDKVSTLVWVYFSYVLYLSLYIVFLGLMNDESWGMTKKTMEMMALICACECIIKVVLLKYETPDADVLTFTYYLGWGLCNEAGIMMCFGLPFVFMNVKDNKKFPEFIPFILKLTLIIIGMIATTSRGTYLFGSILLVFLTIYTFIRHNKKLNFFLSIVSVLALFFLGIQIIYGLPKFFERIGSLVFDHGLSDNGRYNLYDTAVRLWSENALSVIFGKGWVAERAEVWTQLGPQDGYWVYHSTFFETLCCFGVVGLFVMMFHFYEKYKQLSRLNSFDLWALCEGYVIVDLYGMIDNTYNYYYYMIPLVMVMVSIDAISKEKIKI